MREVKDITPFQAEAAAWFPPETLACNEIVSMTVFMDRLFVATKGGVFVKGDDDVFRPMAFEWEKPPCPR